MISRIALRKAFTAASYKTTALPVRAFGAAINAPFTLGDLPRINTTPDHKVPNQENTIEGRYASVLFMGASREENLYDVMEDMAYLGEIYKNSEDFRLFTQNAGVGMTQIKKFNEAL